MEKIVFIDVDGTLTTGLSSWERVHHHFEATVEGMINKMRANEELWLKKEIDYDTWAQLDVALWKGFPYSELERALLPPQLVPGAIEGIQLLNKKGFMTVLVSGGLNTMVDAVRQETGAHRSYSNRVCEKNGIITGKVEVPVGNSKVGIVEEIVKELKVDNRDTYAIGDHVNDIEMFDYVGYALGVNVKRKEVEEHANASIITDNFKVAAQHIIQIAENGRIQSLL